uniref:Cadherin domain-containing protein n=1 Tax=Macrostomum lignano TaxID=282301 RepID=A0A1I8HL70_9PLAT
ILDDSAPFHVLKDTGEIRAIAPIDRESHPEPFVFVVQAYDGSTPRKSGSATVTVNVVDANDNPPACAWRRWQFDISEAAPLNTTVGWVAASDSDSGANAMVSFALVGNHSDGPFGIGASDGRLWLRRSLDRESQDRYELRSLTSECSVLISVLDVNDNDPVPAAATFEFDVRVNEVVGALLGGIFAWDPDAGRNGSVTYSVLPGTAGDSTGSSYIRLNDSETSSGFVYLKRSLTGWQPGQTISAAVVATDGG